MEAERGAKSHATLPWSLDAFKGMLILVVVLDHNNEAHALFPAVFRPLTFHVLGFLLLPFLLPQPRFSLSFLRDRLVRYMVPQFLIVTFAAALFWVLYKRGNDVSQIFLHYLLAVVIGSAPLIKEATGFLAYWFLPTLLGLVAILTAYQSAPVRWRPMLTVSLVAAHAFLVARFFPQYVWIPFGLPIVANIFVLGLVLKFIAPRVLASPLRYLAPVIFVATYGWLVQHYTWLEVAVLGLAPFTNLGTFVVQDIAGISAIITLLMLAPLVSKSRGVVSIGRHSLMIYLLHPLAYIAIDGIRGRLGPYMRPDDMMMSFGALSFLGALFVSWAGAVLISRSKVASTWITPRGWAQWGLVSMACSAQQYLLRRYTDRTRNRRSAG